MKLADIFLPSGFDVATIPPIYEVPALFEVSRGTWQHRVITELLLNGYIIAYAPLGRRIGSTERMSLLHLLNRLTVPLKGLQLEIESGPVNLRGARGYYLHKIRSETEWSDEDRAQYIKHSDDDEGCP